MSFICKNESTPIKVVNSTLNETAENMANVNIEIDMKVGIVDVPNGENELFVRKALALRKANIDTEFSTTQNSNDVMRIMSALSKRKNQLFGDNAC